MLTVLDDDLVHTWSALDCCTCGVADVSDVCKSIQCGGVIPDANQTCDLLYLMRDNIITCYYVTRVALCCRLYLSKPPLSVMA